MRILAVGNLYPPAAAGGYERIFVGAMRALEQSGHEVRVLTTMPVSGRPVAGPDPEGPPVFRELDWWWRDFTWPRRSLTARVRLVRGSAAILDRHLAWEPDVVSWWGMGGLSLSLLEQVRRRGIPAVGMVGDGWMRYGFGVDQWLAMWRAAPRRARLAERLFGVATHVEVGAAARWLFISRALADGMQKQWALPDTALVHPGVDAARFTAQPPGPWAWRLACVGRVEPGKGVATAIEALAQLPAEATLIIDGEAEAIHRAELDTLARRLGVTERVHFTVSRAGEVAATYATADAVLFPVTWPEPWGLVPLEAMSVGRPVVATGTGGSAEYLEDGVNCLLFAPGDAPALAENIRALAADDGLRERLRSAGLATAARYSEDEFNTTVITELARACR